MKVMENLVNQSYETAKKFLEDQGMHVLQGEEFSDDVEEGRVVRTDPAVGTELKDGQTVWVYVSKGPVIEKQKMLNVVGLKYSIAYNQLIGQGFESVDREYVEDDAEKDTVIKQSEDPNTMVDVTTRIVLTVSKGPKPTEAPTKPPTEPPTEAPTKPPEVTVRKTFQLPADRTEDYTLSLKQNGKEVLEPTTITAGTTQIEVELTGTGTQYYDLWINGEYYKTEKVEFTSDG